MRTGGTLWASEGRSYRSVSKRPACGLHTALDTTQAVCDSGTARARPATGVGHLKQVSTSHCPRPERENCPTLAPPLAQPIGAVMADTCHNIQCHGECASSGVGGTRTRVPLRRTGAAVTSADRTRVGNLGDPGQRVGEHVTAHCLCYPSSQGITHPTQAPPRSYQGRPGGARKGA